MEACWAHRKGQQPVGTQRKEPKLVHRRKASTQRKESESEVAQLCLTLCDPMKPTRLLRPWDFPGKSTRVGWPFPSPGALPDPGIEPWFPTLQADALPSEPPGKPTQRGLEQICKNFQLINSSLHRIISCSVNLTVRQTLYPLSHQGSPLREGLNKSARTSNWLIQACTE